MKIRKIVLETGNLKGTLNFYKYVLEFELVTNRDHLIEFAIGNSILGFKENTISNASYHFAFLIPSNKIDEALDYMKQKVPILPFSTSSVIADVSNWNAHAFYFHDNQNNILEFIAHHDLNNNIPTPFNTSDILSLCEIGIVVDDVAKTCKDLNQNYKIPHYTKGPDLANFSVMGDESGLFIISKVDRGWIPTQVPAKAHTTEIFFEQSGTEYHLATK